MGTLQSLLIDGDGWDFQILFKAILSAGFGPNHLVELGKTCKLAQYWIQYQLTQCKWTDINIILNYMPAVWCGDRAMREHRKPESGSFLWLKRAKRDPVTNEYTLYITGLLYVREVRSNDTIVGIWCCFGANGPRSAAEEWQSRKDAFKDQYNRNKTIFARFPMFEQQLLYLHVKDEMMPEGALPLLKKARLQ
jgi:hypothetical protein